MMQIVSYSENSATARAVNGGRAGCEMMLTDVPVVWCMKLADDPEMLFEHLTDENFNELVPNGMGGHLCTPLLAAISSSKTRICLALIADARCDLNALSQPTTPRVAKVRASLRARAAAACCPSRTRCPSNACLSRERCLPSVFSFHHHSRVAPLPRPPFS